MSPERRGREPYQGTERRQSYRREEDFQPIKHGPFTTWQWAVLGSYLVIIVLTIFIYSLAHRADINAHRGSTAICVEVGFVKTGQMANIHAIEKAEHVNVPPQPKLREALFDRLVQRHRDNLTPVRIESYRGSAKLIRRLEETIPHCARAFG